MILKYFFNVPAFTLALSAFDSLTATVVKAQAECPIVETVEDFNIEQYASQPWYVHQQAENQYLPVANNFCVRAEYTLKDNPTSLGYTVGVKNQAQNVLGEPSGGNLCAYQTDEADSKLAVAQCFLPKVAAGPYWIIAYNETEGYALISGGQPTIPANPANITEGCTTGDEVNNSGLWIFSRSKVRSEALVTKVRSIAKRAGFDLSVLNDINHVGCDYSLACPEVGTDLFFAENNNGKNRIRDCNWLKNKPRQNQNRKFCRQIHGGEGYPPAGKVCTETCAAAELGRTITVNGKEKSCKWLRKRDTTRKEHLCINKNMNNICYITCGGCPE